MKTISKSLICIILFLGTVSCSQEKVLNNICIIPDGYIGPILIMYSQPDGISTQMEGDTAIYRINNSGVLMVKEDLNYNHFKTLFYYEDEGGNRQKVFSPLENKTMKNDSAVFCLTEEVSSTPVNKSNFKYRVMLIGRQNQKDSLYNKKYIWLKEHIGERY